MKTFRCRVCGGNDYGTMGGVSLYFCTTCSTTFTDILRFNLPLVQFKKLKNNEYAKPKTPRKAYSSDTGYDMFSIEEKIIKPYTTEMIKTGICVQFPYGIGAEIRPRSGLAYKHGIMVTNSPGTIDNAYRNEIRVLLYNSSNIEYKIQVHDKIAQLVFENTLLPKLIEVDEFNNETDRGLNGFGSTGKQ